MEMDVGKETVKSSSHIFSAKNAPRFFKLYLPEHNSKKLLMPPLFIKYFNGKVPKNIRLKNLKGNAWTTKVEVVQDGNVYITRGWEEYASSHSLVRGDFLVFKPLTSSDFYVKVFDIDGCIKEEPVDGPVDEIVVIDQFAKTSKKCVVLGLANATDTSFRRNASAGHLQFTKYFAGSLKTFVCMPKNVIEQCELTLPQDIILRSNRGLAIETRLHALQSEIGMGCSALRWFWQQSEVVDGDKLNFTVIFGEGKKIKEFHVKISRRRSLTRRKNIIGQGGDL